MSNNYNINNIVYVKIIQYKGYYKIEVIDDDIFYGLTPIKLDVGASCDSGYLHCTGACFRALNEAEKVLFKFF